MLLDFLKMELFRLVKMKTTYIMPVIIFLYVIIYCFIVLAVDFDAVMANLVGDASYDYEVEYDIDSEDDEWAENDELTEDDDSYDVFSGPGVSDEELANQTYEKQPIIGEGVGYHQTVIETYQMAISGLVGLLILAILAGLFWGNDYSTHIGKNFPIINGRRWIGLTAKLLALAIYVMAFHLFIWIICFVSHVIWAEKFTPIVNKDSIVYFFLSYLTTMAIMMMIGFITTLFKSKAAGVTFGVLTSLGTFTMPIKIVDLIVQVKYEIEDFSLAHYFPTGILSQINLETSGKIVIIGFICAIIYFVSTYFGSLMLLKKRDLAT